jgi:hypothetical protein
VTPLDTTRRLLRIIAAAQHYRTHGKLPQWAAHSKSNHPQREV